MPRLSVVGISGLQAGEDVNGLGYERLEFEDPATFKKYRTYRKDGVRVALQAGYRLGEHKGYAWVFHGDVDDLIIQALITDPAFRRKGKARAALAISPARPTAPALRCISSQSPLHPKGRT